MIEIEHLSKRYGEHPAVSDLSVTIESGQIYGFLGPNGAGKATTMMFCSLESWEMPYILLCLHFYRSRNWLSMLFRRTDSM